MASTGGLFSQTLQDITNTKLEELAKKRDNFEQLKKDLLAIKEHDGDSLAALSDIASGMKKAFGVAVGADGRVVRYSTNNPRLEVDLKNLDRFLSQARYDPSVSQKIVDQWKQSLLRHLSVQSLKYSYASLYGQLTTEWLSNNQQKGPLADDADTDMEDFEHVSTALKMESRSNWEKSVFEAANVDEVAIDRLLKDVFEATPEDSRHLVKALKAMRESVAKFHESLLSPNIFHRTSIHFTIGSLLSSDLLSNEKRAVLEDFRRNDTVLDEIADVLNMRMVALDSWSWGDRVCLEQRRQLNGNFSITMDEDLLQAIFLDFIGVKWSVFWKKTFKQFLKAKDVWKSTYSSVSLIDKKRRVFFLGPKPAGASTQVQKRRLYRESYFVSRLLDSETQNNVSAQGDEEADFALIASMNRPTQTARAAMMAQQKPQQPSAQYSHAPSRGGAKRHRQIIPDDEEETGIDSDDESEETEDQYDSSSSFKPKNHMDAKQTLLHLLSSDIQIKARIHGEISCFRSQFADFYPSLPHAVIRKVLSFFGVSERWLSFFARFLQAPLVFQDDQSANPRLRRRGTPGSHVLSEVFGEVILFCLDFKVNQNTNGECFWRLHDDFWYWTSDFENCTKAWTIITKFAQTMGLSLDESKSGSARISDPNARIPKDRASAANGALPQGLIRWGMLSLNPESGRFEINQDMVDHHINELSRQLKDKSKSIFAWIQAWNTYATTFFTSNFGKPANCFGRQHVDDMLATHNRIQRMVVSASRPADARDMAQETDSVLEQLKQMIGNRFGVNDIPDGYFFFPVELGGLEMQSPFIGLLQIRDAVESQPLSLLDKFLDAEAQTYRRHKIAFENKIVGQPSSRNDDGFRPQDADTFMSFEEYTKHREEIRFGFDDELAIVFKTLMQRPREQSIDYHEHGSIILSLNALSTTPNLRGILSNWHSMEPYWRWVAQLYGPEMIDRFGGLSIVDPSLLPIGMVSLFRSGRVTWQD